MRKVLYTVVALLLLLPLVACSSPASSSSSAAAPPPASPAPSSEAAPSSSSVPAPSSASLAPPVNADAPLPGDAKNIVLQEGELLFSAELESESAEQFLICFVLAADGQSAHDIMIQITGLTVIQNPEGAQTPVVLESSTKNIGEQEVVGNVLTVESDSVTMELTIDGEVATGTVTYNEYYEGFSFEGFEDQMIVGMEYPDPIPPHRADLGTMDAEFNVAARGE